MRKLPVLPDIFGLAEVSILDTLGVVDDPAATAPADGQSFAETVVTAATALAGFDEENSAAPGVLPDLVTFVWDSIAEAGGASSAIQSSVGLLSLPLQAAADLGSPALGAQPAEPSEITLIDAVFAAKGGVPGPGGGGGGGDGGGSGVDTEYLSGSQNGEAGYDIWIQFKGSSWTENLQQAFKNAADYLTTVITDDIGGGGRYRGVTIDDLYVTAELKAIDGEGGILGQAGPTAVWTATELTAAGQMQFDIADALTYFDKGLWDDIVTHELMHVLGFGSLWNYGTNPLVSGNQYLGAKALYAYQKTHPGELFIPVEDEFGSGTAGSHWDEGSLTNELMTGFINDDGNPATVNDNYLSEFSVMSLADLAYTVAYQDYPYDGLTA